MRIKALAPLLAMLAALALTGCAPQDAPTQEEQAEPAQKSLEETLDEVGREHYSAPCPVSGSVATVTYYKGSTRWQALDGSVHSGDALDAPVLLSASDASGLDTTNPSNAIKRIEYALFFKDKSGDYIGVVTDAAQSVPAYSEVRETLVDGFSDYIGNGTPSRYEAYVYHVVLQDGSEWGAGDLSELDAETQYRVVLQKSHKLDEGNVSVLG